MTLLSFIVCNTGCEDRIDRPVADPSGGKTVEVALNIGFADEADGYALSSASKAVPQKEGAFDVELVPAVATRAGDAKPTKLYKLEIRQYKQDGTYLNGSAPADQAIGGKLSVNLTEYTDCQLVFVAWGEKSGKSLGEVDLSEAQKISVDASEIQSITTDMNKMPYVLHLEHVNVTGSGANGVISSPDGKDVRIQLKRLVTRLTLSWNYSYTDYSLKQILLESIPLNYNVIAKPDKKENNTYPSLLEQYTTIQLSEDDIKNGSYTCWIPANVRGTNSESNSALYRIKANAPMGSSYASFIAVNEKDTKKKLNYRVYLGGPAYTDFNLYGNTDYSYTVNINHAGLPVNDRRVTIIDPIPASESNNNLVPTSNCFMVAPGGAFCFNPYKYYVNGAETENTLLQGWCSSSRIQSVKVLWQTKENGDVGDPVLGVVNSSDDHTNIVDLKNGTEFNQTRIYCRVAPNTMGGSGLIAAYDNVDGTGNILWSWHIWVTDYSPAFSGNSTVLTPDTKRKLKFIWNLSVSDQLPMMDRNLGAMAGYINEAPGSDLNKSRTNGLQYQWGRKEPFTSSYSSESITSIPSISSDKPVKNMSNRYGPDGLSYVKVEYVSVSSLRDAYKYPHKIARDVGGGWWITDSGRANFWGGGNNTTKTVHDPCPAGWKVAENGSFNSFFTGTTTNTYNDPNISNMETYRADGGYLCYFGGKKSGDQVYVRLTGYAPPNNGYCYIGQRLAYWMSGESQAFISLLGSESISEFKTNSGSSRSDCNSIRCLQEKE